MDRRSYSSRPLIIVDDSGTVSPDGLNTWHPKAPSMFRKETPSDSSPVCTRTCPVPPAGLPLTIDRSTAPPTGSILRRITIPRPRTSARRCGSLGRVHWAIA